MKGNSPLFINDYEKSSYLGIIEYNYSLPLNGASQPFQEQYSVYSKMKKKDIKHGIYDIKNGGYNLNPTSMLLERAVKGDYIFRKDLTTRMPYVINSNGDVIIGKRNGYGKSGPQTPHPTLIGGYDPKVKMAGMLYIRNGKIVRFDDRSGHYRPNIKSMKYAEEAFAKYQKYMEKK